MADLKYTALGAIFFALTLASGAAGCAIREPTVVALSLLPCFACGWCAAKASWSA